jgi:hypothetical protein
MEEHPQRTITSEIPIERDRAEAVLDFFERGHSEARLNENPAQGIHVIADHPSTEQGGLENCCPTAGEGIVHEVSRLCQALNEKPRELGLEACTVGDFVERATLALF